MEIKTIRVTNKKTVEKMKQFISEKERAYKKMSDGKALQIKPSAKSC
jgi:hypothetical protein